MSNKRGLDTLRKRLDYINSHPRPSDGLRAEASALRWALNQLAGDSTHKETENHGCCTTN